MCFRKTEQQQFTNAGAVHCAEMIDTIGILQQPLPERVINADPLAWYTGDPSAMGAENYAEFRAATHDPEVVRGMLEDYRAGLGVDRAADEADRAAGRRITCPTLVLWSARDDLEELHGDPLPIWARWTADLRGGGRIDSGHHIAEEAPRSWPRRWARSSRADHG